MIILQDISLRRGSKLLLEEVNLTIQPGQRLALIGANGCGKSSLFSLLLGDLAQDKGDITGLNALRLSHMAQEVTLGKHSACEYVWRGDTNLAQLNDKLIELERSEDFEKAAVIHQQLEELDGYSAERRAILLLQGLGFGEEDNHRAASDFSGGWRIRLNLARALMTPSDVLLLDEPTNHLDLDATLWLQQWLQRYQGTLILISHDRDFIDATCSRVLHIEHGGLSAYTGNYSTFEALRAQRLANDQAAFEKQQRRIEEIDSFVRRFRYKATKAKQAQSRLKELERMQKLAPAHVDSPFDFTFLPPSKSSDPLISLREATLGYGDTAVLEKVSLDLRPGDRVGLLGRNGAGKSTLLKSIKGGLPLISGHRTEGDHLHIGYFDQQQLEVLDLAASPALHLQRLKPEAREQEVLNFLGGFNFSGDHATAPAAPLSGGEKARLALAMIVWLRPNLLVLDEPTNHLDLDMRQALEYALQSYEGALILVSHDRHMLRNSVEELLLVNNGSVSEYKDDFKSYERWLLSSYSSEPVKDSPSPATSRKNQRQQAAAEREQLRPLQKKVNAAENALGEVEEKLKSVQGFLAEEGIYSEERKEELAALLLEEGRLNAKVEELENTWLELLQELEEKNA
jgi:ATP-binding cassette subfamily F protein 3